MGHELEVLDGRLAICRLAADDPFPGWAARSGFHSLTRSGGELSVVCDEDEVPGTVTADRGWRALRVKGRLDLGEVGVLAGLAAPLAEAKISVFALSTYDTDYLLVRGSQLGAAVEALRRSGHEVAR